MLKRRRIQNREMNVTMQLASIMMGKIFSFQLRSVRDLLMLKLRKIQNREINVAMAACDNEIGLNFFDANVFDQASIEATGEQSLEQGSECNIAFCANSFGGNFLGIGGSGDSFVQVDATQDSDQGNECSGGSSCDNAFAVNQINTISTEQATINSKANQNVEQGNKCNNGVQCSNAAGDIDCGIGANDVSIRAYGESSVVSNANQELKSKMTVKIKVRYVKIMDSETRF